MNSIKRSGREPLTRADLTAIQEKLRDTPEGRALLWEVFRLRTVVLRSHDYLRLNPQSSTASIMREGLIRELDDEPVVREQPKL